MRRIIFLGFFAVFIGLISTAQANLIEWDTVIGSDVKTSDNSITIDPTGRTQARGFHGGGFIAEGPSIDFSLDIWTNDSYSNRRNGGGWYDVFVVNINQEGFILDDKWLNPVVGSDYGGSAVARSPVFAGSTLAWGGKKWTDCTLEELVGDFTLSLDNYVSDQDVFVSVGWKTTQDRFFTSGGSVEFSQTPAAPVPEPTTMLLVGTGLVGLIGANRKKKKKRDLWK